MILISVAFEASSKMKWFVYQTWGLKWVNEKKPHLVCETGFENLKLQFSFKNAFEDLKVVI